MPKSGQVAPDVWQCTSTSAGELGLRTLGTRVVVNYLIIRRNNYWCSLCACALWNGDK